MVPLWPCLGSVDILDIRDFYEPLTTVTFCSFLWVSAAVFVSSVVATSLQSSIVFPPSRPVTPWVVDDAFLLTGGEFLQRTSPLTCFLIAGDSFFVLLPASSIIAL